VRYTIPKDEVIVLTEFLAESHDHLEGIEDKVLQMEVSKDPELINSIFRPIHTVKGTSSFLGLESISRLSHEMETLLDDIRKGRIIPIDSDIIDVILESVDTLDKMIRTAADAMAKADTSTDPVETEIEDIPYFDVMNRVMDVRKSKNAKPAEAETTEKSGTVVEESRDIDYSKISYPGEMKMQFEIEGIDKINVIERTLLTLEKTPQNIDLYNDLFRALHTLKGNTGVILSTIDDDQIRQDHFLNKFREIAHNAESFVQKKRDTKRQIKEDEIEILLNAADCMKHGLQAFKENRKPEKEACVILEQLETLTSATLETVYGSAGGIKEIGGDSLAEAVSNNLQQALEAIGAGLDEIGDDQKRENALKKMKRNYKNLVKIGTKINHELLVNKSGSALKLIDFMMIGKDENEEIFIEELKKDFLELKGKADRRKDRETTDRRKATLPPPTTDKELEVRIGEKVLKVSQEKIDVFMNLIGELLVSKNNLLAFEREVSLKYDLPEIARRLKESADTIARISNQLQTNIMEIRMLPVASSFSKFPRMIRDLSKKLDKKMRLVISGEETEVDKNVIEALTDPLVHMVRNSADHGIETPDVRTAAGKPEEGTITLNAFNQGQYVVIQIIDDGRGMDPHKIKMKALEKALITPEEVEQMDDLQALNLIFLPGFSMAGKVSDVSGRGVGMDVVKNNIEKLGGEAHIESKPGEGSTFTVKLPLTMAIGRGLEVEAAKNRYYIPLEAIIETLRIPTGSIFKYRGKEMTVIRDELIPVYNLAAQLGLESGNGDPRNLRLTRKNEALVLLDVKGQKLGLTVDNYYNETEYVIKPLTGTIANIEGISGAMITGEGKVNLILDLMRLF
jgi:two-component system chemotaxis sensor kinase CheA